MKNEARVTFGTRVTLVPFIAFRSLRTGRTRDSRRSGLSNGTSRAFRTGRAGWSDGTGRTDGTSCPGRACRTEGPRRPSLTNWTGGARGTRCALGPSWSVLSLTAREQENARNRDGTQC